MHKRILPLFLLGAQHGHLSNDKISLQLEQRRIGRYCKLRFSTTQERRHQEENVNKDFSRAGQEIKWRWAGHVVRLENNRWGHAVMIWDLWSGSRSGRPVTRWTNDMKKQTGNILTKTASNSNDWKNRCIQVWERKLK